VSLCRVSKIKLLVKFTESIVHQNHCSCNCNSWEREFINRFFFTKRVEDRIIRILGNRYRGQINCDCQARQEHTNPAKPARNTKDYRFVNFRNFNSLQVNVGYIDIYLLLFSQSNMKTALVLLHLIYVTSTGALEVLNIPDPTCFCPHNVPRKIKHHSDPEFCGNELREMNKRSNEKVIQTTCDDKYVYECPRFNAPSVIIQRCGNEQLCMHPPKGIFRNGYFKDKKVPVGLRMCVNQTELGK